MEDIEVSQGKRREEDREKRREGRIEKRKGRDHEGFGKEEKVRELNWKVERKERTKEDRVENCGQTREENEVGESEVYKKRGEGWNMEK